MKAIPRAGIREFLERASKGSSLVAPVNEDGVLVLRPVDSADGVELDYGNTVNSIKELFLPQTERLMRFAGTGAEFTVEECLPKGKWILFGARPCDLGSLELLDRVFLEGEFRDTYYERRRQAVTTIGLACKEPGRSCFCTSFGLSPGSTRGADLMLYEDGDRYLAHEGSERGSALLRAIDGLLEVPDAEAQKVMEGYARKPTPLDSAVDPRGVSEMLDGAFEHPMWSIISKRCTSCGICTYVCPTCYCFCVTDSALGDRGVRYRCWDACMFPDFLLMAGGHNPRPTKKERVRQRFMHKLNYYVHRYGDYLCVGCGRCVEKCPVGLHIAGVIKDVRRFIKDAQQSAS